MRKKWEKIIIKEAVLVFKLISKSANIFQLLSHKICLSHHEISKLPIFPHVNIGCQLKVCIWPNLKLYSYFKTFMNSWWVSQRRCVKIAVWNVHLFKYANKTTMYTILPNEDIFIKIAFWWYCIHIYTLINRDILLTFPNMEGDVTWQRICCALLGRSENRRVEVRTWVQLVIDLLTRSLTIHCVKAKWKDLYCTLITIRLW